MVPDSILFVSSLSESMSLACISGVARLKIDTRSRGDQLSAPSDVLAVRLLTARCTASGVTVAGTIPSGMGG